MLFLFDGLRGLAVAVVVLYHAWPELLPGGWIGVSVFFTLSGFLITQILLGDDRPIDQKGMPFASFWSRRARRLLPAALATVSVTVLAVVVIRGEVDNTLDAALAATFIIRTENPNRWAESNPPGDG